MAFLNSNIKLPSGSSPIDILEKTTCLYFSKHLYWWSM